MRETIVPGPEGLARRFTGQFVTFDLRRKSGAVTREKGEVTGQKWLGFTVRGLIPEYEVTIRGTSGTLVSARITEDFVRLL
jgi:hypothetical protein